MFNTTHFDLLRLNCGYHENAALSFKFGAISATTVCLIGYLLYNWPVS
jgi:hypothetical protein